MRLDRRARGTGSGIASLHGVGPKAFGQFRNALAEQDMDFASDSPAS